MTYNESLDWLVSHLPMYQRIGKAAYKADLNTTIELLRLLGNPESSFRAIHVAGTNGKGSVSHLIASILQEAGYSVGLYTSPHLKDFRERIKINGEMVSQDEVCHYVEQYKPVFEQLKPSFFEMTVGLAYKHFASHKVDFAVLETGMGGRLDSTNICHPLISVITNIGYDHMAFLGNRLEDIAVEKAGIIKKGIPVVVGMFQNEVASVFEKVAKEQETDLCYADQNFELRKLSTPDLHHQLYDVWYKNQIYLEQLSSPLMGNYQSHNIATALQVIEVLKLLNHTSIGKAEVVAGVENVLQHTGLMGRWQTLSSNPLTICDTAHNLDGIQAVVAQLSETPYKQLHIVFGLVNDKDPVPILQLLPKQATYYFCRPDIPRGMDADTLMEYASQAGLWGKTYSSVRAALNNAQNNAGVNDLVFVGGSTFVVAEVV